jgi:hypothetical protein
VRTSHNGLSTPDWTSGALIIPFRKYRVSETKGKNKWRKDEGFCNLHPLLVVYDLLYSSANTRNRCPFFYAAHLVSNNERF